MATPIPSVSTATTAAPATAAGTTTTGGTADSPFDSILAAAVGTAEAESTTPVLADAADPRTTDQNAAALAAAGVLLVVPGIVPAAPQATPTTTESSAPSAAAPLPAATAFADADADVPADPAPPEARTRAEELALRNPTFPRPEPARVTPADAPPAETPPKTPADATAIQPVRPRFATPQAVAAERAATPTNPLPAGAPAARFPTIPAQAPIVTDAVAPPPSAAPPVPPTDPVVTAPDSVAALPDVSVGDRPSVAGERFAALASAGTRLAGTAPPAAPFLQRLAEATPTPVAANVSSARIAPPADASPLMVSRALAEPTAAPPKAASGVRVRPLNETNDADAGAAFGAPPVTVPTGPRATDAPPAVAAPRPAPAAVQVADGVVAHARTLTETGEVEFRMRLDPPELGRVHVRLVGSGDDVRGQVVVADDAVRRMIESQLPELRQRLEAAGLTVQRFDVTTDPGGGGWGGFRGDDRPAVPFAVPETAARPGAFRPSPAAATAGGLDVTV